MAKKQAAKKAVTQEVTKEVTKRKIDPFTTIIPLVCILALCAYFVLAPENSGR